MPDRSSPLFSTAAWLLLFCLIFVGIGPLYPQMPAPGLDPSWVQVLNFAYLNELQWGRDIVFTYGPLGFIFSKPFDPQLFVTLFLYWLLIGVAGSLALTAILDGKGWLINSLALALACFLLPLFSAGLDAFFLLLCALALLHYVDGGKTWFRSIQGLLIVALAAVALMKTTVALFALFNLLLIDILRVRDKRLPIHVLLWSGFYLLFYLSAGQRFASLPDYWHSALEVARGYGPAMSLVGSETEYATYLIASAALLAGFLLSLWFTPSFKRFLLFVGLSALWFFTYKQGFTRHDQHSDTAWLGLLFLLLFFLQLICTARARIKTPIGVALLLLLLLSISWSRGNLEDQIEQSAELTQGFWEARFDDAGAFVKQPVDWFEAKSARYQDAIQTLARDYRWIAADTHVDSIPSIQSAIIFSRARYQPRPVFQEYSTYTPDLIELNKQFFAQTPPELLIFSPHPIDGRYPALTESGVWPVVFNQYRIDTVYDGHLILKRRSSPLHVEPTLLVEHKTKLNTPIAIPKTQGFTWIEIDLHKSPSGKLASLLLNDSAIQASIARNGHPARRYRIVPGIVEQGFFIDPLFSDSYDLVDGFFQQEQGLSNSSELTLTLQEQPFLDLVQYEQEVTVRVFEYDYRYRDMLSAQMRDIWRRHQLNYRLAASSPIGRPFVYAEKNKIYAHAPARMSIDIENAGAIALNYGVAAGAVYRMHGVCFGIALDSNDSERQAGEVCIPQQAGWQDKLQWPFLWTFDRPTSGRLTISTSCMDNQCGFAWAYLSDFSITPFSADSGQPASP